MRRFIAISHIRPELEAVPEAFRDRYAVALELTEFSPNETIARARQSLISKCIAHIHLFDAFSDYISQTTQSHIAVFTEWRDAISQIQTRAESIKDPEFRIATQRYIASWENFLCMYLIFKRANDGTI